MAKQSIMTLRVDAEAKQRITAAAHHVGKSITNFALEATMNSVEQVENSMTKKKSTQRTQGACPAYFRALCMTAQAGGESGYYHAGHALARGLESEGSYEMTSGEWDAEISKLEELLSAGGNDDDVIAWFERNLPRCVELVPRRRRAQFVEGVRGAFKEEGCISPHHLFRR
jgi:predicted DNA-binding protein